MNPLLRAARILLLVLVALWPLAAIEVVVEASGAAPPRAPPVLIVWTASDDHVLTDANGRFRANRFWLWEPRPGADFDGEIINEDGQRGPRVPQTARSERDRLCIVTLGDSSTFGMNVQDEQCFSRRMEALLRERGVPVDVVNLGCIGYSARQALEIYRGKGRDWQPDVVIAAVGAVNEHWPGPEGLSDAQRVELNSKPTKQLATFLDRFATFRWLEILLAPSARDSRVPSMARVRRRVPLAEFDDDLMALRRAVEDDGAKLLLVVPPRRADAETKWPEVLDYSHSLREVTKDHGIAVADVHRVFREKDLAAPAVAADPTLSPLFNHPTDNLHPSPLGHQLYAETLVAELDRLGWLATGSLAAAAAGVGAPGKPETPETPETKEDLR